MAGTYTVPNGVRIFGPGTPADYMNYDTIVANDEGDEIYGDLLAPMTITGGAGNDTLIFTSVLVHGGSISGGAGDDILDASRESPYAAGMTTLDSGSGNDTLIGGGRLDMLVGHGLDTITGSSVAGATNTFVLHNSFGSADPGHQALLIGGLAAHNTFYVSGSYNIVHAGDLGDEITIGPSGFGFDTVYGGAGNDTYFDSGHDNTIIERLQSTSNDTVWGQFADGDTITLGNGNNIVYTGGSSSTAATTITAGTGNNTINGAGGQNRLDITVGLGADPYNPPSST